MPSTDAAARRRRRRRLAAAAGVALVALALVAAFSVRSPRVRKAVRDTTGIGAPGAPRIVDDVSIKADLIDDLDAAPGVVVLGGSRSQRFEPAYLEKTTGRPAFNAGVHNGRPEEAWALVSHLRERFPEARPAYLWTIHATFLREYESVSPSLVVDPRLKAAFPQEFLDEQREELPRKYFVNEREVLTLSDRTRYDASGWVRRERKSWKPEQFEYWADKDIENWLENNPPGRPSIDARPREYFEKTLALMNDQGTRPVLVLMPEHPRKMAAIRDEGWTEAHRAVLAYLGELAATYDFTVLDFSRVESFDGDPDQFYDGHHPRIVNLRRIVDEILVRHPDAFE